MTLQIGVLLGDDIGLEVVPECVKVMKAAAGCERLAIDWHPLPIGKAGHEAHSNTLPAVTEQALLRLDGWIMGPIGHAAYPRGDATWVMPPVRKKFDLFAALRPALSHANIPSIHKDVDIAFFRPSANSWYVLRSEDNSFYGFPFASPGDIPMPADFDGDGKADPAVYHFGDWYILRSSDSGVTRGGEVAALDEEVLVAMLGPAAGHHLHALAHNLDPRPVETGRRRRSMGAHAMASTWRLIIASAIWS